jgi:hypothetical protein
LLAVGVKALPLIDALDCEVDKMGRAIAEKNLTIPGADNIFVIGDAAHLKTKMEIHCRVLRQLLYKWAVTLGILSKKIDPSEMQYRSIMLTRELWPQLAGQRQLPTSADLRLADSLQGFYGVSSTSFF